MNQLEILRKYKAFFEEHQDKSIIKKIIESFNIKYVIENINDLDIYFTDNSITLKNMKNNTTYKVEINTEFENEIYIVTSDYNNYSIISMYTKYNELFRKSAVFPINEEEILVLDELDEIFFKKRSILITNKRDLEFLNGSYEYETLNLPTKHITEKYEYLENGTTSTRIKKIVYMNDNIYYYTFSNNNDILKVDNFSTTIETGVSINTPKTTMTGRIRNDAEILQRVISIPFPNIAIKEKINKDEFYLTIVKIFDKIKILINTTINNQNEKKQYSINSKNEGAISIEDINFSISFIKETISENYSKPLISELEKIIEVINTNGKSEEFELAKNINLFQDFNELAFNIYLNLQSYIETIKKIKSQNNNNENEQKQKKL